MKKIIVSLMIIALVVGAAWISVRTVQATQSVSPELVACQLPNLGQCGLMTAKACQNSGGKVVANCNASVPNQ